VEAAAKSAPDGYTVFLGNVGSIAINPSVFPNLPVDPMRDLVAITQVVDVSSVLVTHPSLPVNSVKELVSYAKANPGKLNFASPGSGSQNRLEMELFRKLEGLDMVHVPYKGGAGPAMAGLVAGETQLAFTTAASAIGYIQSGRIRLLAVTSAKRMTQFPQAPTMIESGYRDFVSSSWQGMFVPAGTPREIIDKLFAVLQQTMKAPEVIDRLAKNGADVTLSASPKAFAEFVASETARWGKVARESGATVD
jgi:tripartite-type tricarboxylate transporter receptor subunit TctC